MHLFLLPKVLRKVYFSTLKSKFNILEPIHSKKDFCPIEKIDLFLIPLVAFDAQCHRIGRGAGCYDRALASRQKNATLIGLAYEFQRSIVLFRKAGMLRWTKL